MPYREIFSGFLSQVRRAVGVWGRASVTLAAAILATGCYDQPLVPNDEASERVTIVNDELELEQRMEIRDQEIPIDPLDTPPAMTAGGPVWVGPALAPRSITLTLKGEATSPTVSGQVLQATMIQQSEGNRAIVSYAVAGAAALGGIDLFQFAGDNDPRLKSTALISDADVFAVALDASFAYAAQSSADPARPEPAVLERFVVAADKLTLDGLVEVPLTSFAATSAVSDGSVVYATSGNDGGVYALDPSDLSVLAEYPLDDARWITLDGANNRVVVAQGVPGRLSVFEAGNFAGGTLQLLDTWAFPGADVAESKTTVEVHGGKAFVAAGPAGVQVVCLDDGQVVGTIPRPDPGALGLDPSVVVTNAVTVEDDLIFISNGEAGVYAAAADASFASTPCTDTQAITVLGRVRFDNLQSANHVEYNSNRLWVAAGLGGVKVVRVQVRR